MHVEKPSKAMHARRRVRHWGRGQGCILSIFVLTLLFLCSCTASLALYIAFPPNALDIVVMGLDSRGNEGAVTRTDSVIVVGVQPSNLTINLLSIPRDIFINTPGYGLQRINTINVLGELDESGSGPQLLSDAIEMSFGIGTDRYMRLDFQAFTSLVDAVGGITIDVPYLVVDNMFPTADYGIMSVRFEEGRQQMNGETALIYARTRHQDDDYRRAERQQQVVNALSRKLVNPLNWLPAWIAIQQHTETNLNILDIGTIIPPLFIRAGNFNQLVINRDYILPGDGYVTPNYNALNPYIQEHFN